MPDSLIPVIAVGEVVDDVNDRVFPLKVIAVPVVVMPVTVAAAELAVMELFRINPVFVKEHVIPIVVPVCVPEILIVLPSMVLLLTAGEPGPPKLLIAVAEVVPARFVNVMLLFEIVSATSEGVPDVD